ncbi:MAG: S8 family peptidase [Bariatricus sp.]
MYNLKRNVHYWCQDTISGNLTGKGIGIAVLDTGIAPHPDLKERLIAWKDMVHDRENPYDDNGHGTHVAGILSGDGRSSRKTISGMAPKSGIMAVKVLNSKGDGKISHVIGGIRFILQERHRYHIRIVNISIGTAPHPGNEDEDELVYWVEQLWDAGLVVVTAAGNLGPDTCSITLPGISRKVITVGSCLRQTCSNDVSRQAFLYSGCGPTEDCVKKPDITAPGNGIYSCNYRYPVYSRMPYLKKSGTSMATPVVSGSTALLLEKYPDMRNTEVKLRLWESCDDLGLPENRQGHGQINVAKLLS